MKKKKEKKKKKKKKHAQTDESERDADDDGDDDDDIVRWRCRLGLSTNSTFFLYSECDSLSSSCDGFFFSETKFLGFHSGFKKISLGQSRTLEAREKN